MKIKKRKSQKPTNGDGSAPVAAADNRPPFTPKQVGAKLTWHVESVRRKLRNRDWASIIISRRRYIPAGEVDRIMQEGFISRAE